MSKKTYSEAERAEIRQSLIVTGFQLYGKQGIQHTPLSQIYEAVGISRTFFYSFFPTKELFLGQVLAYQRPVIIQYAQAVMHRPELSWREKVQKILRDCCYSEESGQIILSIEEEQAVRRALTTEGFLHFRAGQSELLRTFLEVLDVPANEAERALLGNLTLSMAIVRRSIPQTLPLLFESAADAMVEFQLNSIVDYMEQLRQAHQI